MNGFINFLNSNQGVIGFLSLIVALLGFFIVNKSINKRYSQTQKNISGGVNQQAQNGGINQNADRNTISK